MTSQELVLVTGASRGFGRAVACAFARKHPTADFILFSRNEAALLETARMLSGMCNSGGGRCSVSTCVVDFVDVGSLQTILEEHLTKCKNDKNYTKIYLINNHGSLGPLKYQRDLLNSGGSNPVGKELVELFNVNVTSVIVLNSLFLSWYSKVPAKVIVNVSSLAAIQAFPSWGVYCSGKAARDMLHKVLAEEEAKSNVRVLNYAPGPLDTEMQRITRETCSDETLRATFAKMYEEGKLVSPDDSAQKLLLLLDEDKYTQGQHIDYFD